MVVDLKVVNVSVEDFGHLLPGGVFIVLDDNHILMKSNDINDMIESGILPIKVKINHFYTFTSVERTF